MNVLDYNKRLADYRNRFSEDTQKMRASHKASLNNEKETHDAQRDRQFETYAEDINDIREDSTKLVDRSREKNAFELEKRRERYTQKLKEQSKDFADLSKERIDDFRKKNENLRESFLDNKDQMERTQNKSLENAKKNFENRLAEITNNQQEQLNLIKNNEKSNDDTKFENLSKEKQNLKDSYEQKLTDQRMDQRQETNEFKERVGKDIDNMERTFTDVAFQRRENQAKNTLNQKNKYEQNFKDHQNQTEERIQKNRQTNINSEQKLIQDYDKKISNIEESYQKKLDFEKNKDNLYEEGSFEDFTAAREKELGEARLTHKIEELGKTNYNLKEEMGEREVKLSKKAQDDIKRIAEEEKQKRIELERDFSKTTIEQAARHAKKTNKIVDSLESKIKEQDRVAESQIRNTEDRSQEQIQKLKENFNTSLADISYKSGKQVDIVQEQAEADKKTFMNRVIEEKTNDKLETVRDHKKRLLSMQGDYEKKISNLEMENQKIKNQMNFTVQNLTQKHTDIMEDKQAFFDDYRKSELRRFESRLIDKDNEYKKTIQGVHGQYQKRMEDQRVASLNELRNQSNDYELKMSNMSKKHKDMVTELVRNHQRLLDEKTNQLDIEKAQLITKYENEISRLTNLHQLEKDRVDKYQRLASQPA